WHKADDPVGEVQHGRIERRDEVMSLAHQQAPAVRLDLAKNIVEERHGVVDGRGWPAEVEVDTAAGFGAVDGWPGDVHAQERGLRRYAELRAVKDVTGIGVQRIAAVDQTARVIVHV